MESLLLHDYYPLRGGLYPVKYTLIQSQHEILTSWHGDN